MNFWGSIREKLQGLLADGNDELLLFTLLFPLLLSNTGMEIFRGETGEKDSGTFLFFVVLIAALILSSDFPFLKGEGRSYEQQLIEQNAGGYAGKNG